MCPFVPTGATNAVQTSTNVTTLSKYDLSAPIIKDPDVKILRMDILYVSASYVRSTSNHFLRRVHKQHSNLTQGFYFRSPLLASNAYTPT